MDGPSQCIVGEEKEGVIKIRMEENVFDGSHTGGNDSAD